VRSSRDYDIVICCSRYIKLSIRVQGDHLQLAGSSWWHCSQDTLSSPSLGWSKSVPHSGQNKSDPDYQDVGFCLSIECNADLFYRQRSCKAIIWMNIAMLIAGLACSHTTIQRFFVYDVDQKFKTHLWTLNSWTDDYILLTFPFTDHYMDILPPTHFSVSFILILIFLLEV